MPSFFNGATGLAAFASVRLAGHCVHVLPRLTGGTA